MIFLNKVLHNKTPDLDENYMVCLAARNKKLTAEERKVYDLSRGEMMREEMVKCNQEFIPLPGTYQYGCFKVEILNKDDFVE